MSTAQKAGSNLDNAVANGVHESTGDQIAAHSMRGSGNLRTPQPDVLVRTPTDDHAIELKRNSRTDRGDRATFMDENQDDDISQLVECADGHTRIYAGLKFTRCQMVCVEVDPSDAAHSIAERLPDPFDANVTRTGNVSVRKPRDTNVWPSATAGDGDIEVVCNVIGVDYNE